MCGITEWNGQPTPTELDHINGVRTDNRLENLRILCPNCHAQTKTYRGKNINKVLTSWLACVIIIKELRNKPEWWNGIHTALKMLRPIWAYGFESRLRYFPFPVRRRLGKAHKVQATTEMDSRKLGHFSEMSGANPEIGKSTRGTLRLWVHRRLVAGKHFWVVSSVGRASDF